MATEITLPKLSDTMDEGKILRWLKRVGDQVAPGDVLAEVETDKADMEVEAADGGVLSEIRVQAGETAAVGAVLAVLGGDAKAAKAKPDESDGAAEGKPAKAEKAAKAEKSETSEKSEKPEPEKAAEADEAEEDETEEKDDSEVAATGAAGETDEADDGDGEAPAEDGSAAATADEKPAASAKPAAGGPLKFRPSEGPQASGRKMRASPLAQRLARERGVDLAEVQGSGAEGKIVARDVDSPAPAAPPTKAKARPAKAAEAAALAPGRLELSKMRQSIARRMTEAKNGIPHFYVVAEIAMDEAWKLLEAMKQQVDAKITVSHLVAKATAMALVEHPRVNGQWLDGAVEIPATVNIGLAVAVDDGLVVPVIHGCEALSVGELATEARRLVVAAREGRFAGDDLKGGTFSISNLGILDVDEFSAIINPPQAAILAVGSIKERPVVRGGQIVVGKTMRVTLSCDHRQLNGVEGARFLETFKGILEAPLRMVV